LADILAEKLEMVPVFPLVLAHVPEKAFEDIELALLFVEVL